MRVCVYVYMSACMRVYLHLCLYLYMYRLLRIYPKDLMLMQEAVCVYVNDMQCKQYALNGLDHN